MTAILESEVKSLRFEYTGGNPIYKGEHELHLAGTSDTNWQIYKYTWSGSDLVYIQGPISGAWDSRASLNWT